MSNPNDWPSFYITHQQSLFSPQPATSASSSSTPATSAPVSAPPASSAASLSPEGRVSKPPRRRTRASRRTPTTLLNTDTNNFRAMVQQFTGGPTASAFGSGFSLTTSDAGGMLNSPGAAAWQYPYPYMHARPMNHSSATNSNTQLPYMLAMGGVMNSANPGADAAAVSGGLSEAEGGGNSGIDVNPSGLGQRSIGSSNPTTSWLR